MSTRFAYFATDPAGKEHRASTPADFRRLIEILDAQYPGAALTVRAEIDHDEHEKSTPEALASQTGRAAR